MQLLVRGSGSSGNRAHWALASLVIGVWIVTAVAHLQMPLPPHSAHDGFTLIPQLQKLLLGFAPDAPDFGMFETTWFSGHASASGTTGWGVWSHRLFSNVQSHTWIDAPHPMLLASLFAWILQGSTWGPVLVMMGYLGLVLVSLYIIGSKVSSPRVGVLAAVIAAGSPAIFGTAKYIEPHLPMAAMATVLVALFVHLEDLRRWPLCLLASFVAWSLARTGEGSGEIVIAGLLVVGPALATLVASRHTAARQWLVGFGCLLLPALLLSDLPWMVSAMERVTRAFADPAVQTDVAEKGGWLGSQLVWLGAYGVLMGTDYLRPALAGIMVVSLLGLRRAQFSHRWVVLSWLIVPLVALSWMQRKAAWYGIGLVPPMALLMAIGIEGWGRKGLRNATMGVALSQLVFFSLVPRAAFGEGVLGWLREPLPVHEWRLRRMDLLRPMADEEDEQVRADLDQVLGWLDENHPPGEGLVPVALLTLGNRHDYATRYYLEMHRPDVSVVNLFDPRVRNAGYRNLHPNDFQAVVFVGTGLQAWPPDAEQLGWLKTNLRCTPNDSVDPFLAGVLARGWSAVGITGVYALTGRVGGEFDGERIWEGMYAEHMKLENPLCGD